MAKLITKEDFDKFTKAINKGIYKPYVEAMDIMLIYNITPQAYWELMENYDKYKELFYGRTD